MGLLNFGTLKTTPLQEEEQKRAAQEMQQYWSTEAPVLSAALLQAKGGAFEQMGADTSTASSREATASALSNPALSFMGNPSASRLGDILTRGAAQSGVAATSGRNMGRGIYVDRTNRIIGAGQDVLRKSDSALRIASGIQQSEYQHNMENKVEDASGFEDLATQLGGMISMAGSASGGAGGAGGGAGGGGGGGGG